MYGYVVIVCYLSMAGLLILQYYSNNYIAKVQYKFLTIADTRI